MERRYRIRDYGAGGVPFLKFTLTFDGELGSNGRPKEKWRIRKQFHPQLEELWRTHPALQYLAAHPYVPLSTTFWNLESHHSQPIKPQPAPADDQKHLHLCEPIARGNKRFQPLVRDSLALKCGLKIIFLRKDEPGRVYQGGDLDNRIKTLCDALSVPNIDQVVDDDFEPDPIQCLLEDDRLITSLDVETHRLLSRPDSSQHEVHLLVEVDVRVTHPRSYNQPFLGD